MMEGIKKKFDGLKVFLLYGKQDVGTSNILAQVEADEPELMLFCAYMKQRRKLPDDVIVKAYDRYFYLAEAGDVTNDTRPVHIVDVCEAIWGKLSEEDQREWLEKVT